MKRILLCIAYDGTGYAGFQAQKSGVPTIEGELNRALTDLTGEPVEVIGASRTDAGVHAKCNLAVFDTGSRIPPEKFAQAVNVRLPDQICVIRSMEVPADFHPRRCSTVKTYEYRIYNAQVPDPVRRLYTYFSRYRFDVEAMRAAAAHLAGIHDFKSFCSIYSSAKTTIREVLSVEVEEIPCSGPHALNADGGRQGAGEHISQAVSESAAAGEHVPQAVSGSAVSREAGQTAGSSSTFGSGNLLVQESAAFSRMPREIVIRVTGRGFLYNMVRIIAGTLMEIGRGAKSPDDMPGILAACDRRAAGPTAPACGLMLVQYEIAEPGMEMRFP